LENRSENKSVDRTSKNTYEVYREIVKENIEYDALIEDKKVFRLTELDEMVDIMVDTICSKKGTVRVNGEDVPIDVVKARLLKINYEHMEYVAECLAVNTKKVSNIKAFLLTVLYNAPSTMGSFYRQEVNYDFR